MTASIPTSEHSCQPWRINEIAADFELVDAWRLPAEGNLSEFADLNEIFSLDRLDHAERNSKASRFLFGVRAWLGQRLGWDDQMNTLSIPECTEVSLRERLPDDLVAASIEGLSTTSFLPVFRTETESASELSNNLLHAIMHIGWVDDGNGRYHGQMGVYVKHRQRRSVWYMKAIWPFRQFVVYPSLLKMVKNGWSDRK